MAGRRILSVILGIVGSEAAKFTEATKQIAQDTILTMLNPGDTVVSGECHLGGIDLWAKEIALAIGLSYIGCPPAFKTWQSFKRRNIEIANRADRVICITVRSLPPGFKEGGWERYCYHCKTDSHIKSGGCWTVKYAREKLGKPGEIIVI
jgi:hypothetical protein